MTLVASLTGRHGAILFADAEETISGYTRREINKLVVQEGKAFRFGIAGSCSDGTYADMLQSEICATLALMPEFNLAAIKESLTTTLTTFYSKHIWPRPGDKPEMSYLLVLQPTDGYPTVVHISETVANICTEESKTIGVGSYLADYLFKQMTAGDLPFPPSGTIGFLCASAVYVAKQVRENIQSIGPLKHVAIFYCDGTYDELWSGDIMQIEEAVSSIDEFLGYFYRDVLCADEKSDILGDGAGGWVGNIWEGLNQWFVEWNSDEKRELRRGLRETELRNRRASGE